MQCDTLAFLPHPTDITDIAPPPTRPFASVRFDPLAWSSGSDQRRISGCGIRWLLAGPDSLPLWLCRVCAFVLLRCFSCSHTVLPKEHSLGIIFFSSLSSCKCCIFLQFYLHFTTDYTCMIVYVTNNKEPRTLNLEVRRVCWPIKNRDTMVLKPGTGSFGTVCRCQVLLENEICISIKLVSSMK